MSCETKEMDPSVDEQSEKHLDNIVDLDALGEREGYVLNAELGHADTRHLKTSRDGRTILIPQPSDDPNDPLNWSQTKKNLILLVVSCTAFLPDYGSATGAVTLLPQAAIWNMTPDTVNHSQVGNVFMLGVGGVVAVTLSAYFGRYPVLFWFIVLAVGTAAWCAAAETFPSFMAARILNGFFSTVAQGGGLMFIKDMFFFHEHARKINIWSAFIILSPYFGPMLTAFIINTIKWQWAFGLYTIMTGLCLIAIMLFADETYYDRRIPMDKQPDRGSHISRMLGIAQWRSRNHRNTIGQALQRPFIAISKLPVLLTVVYYMLTFAWVVGINTTLAIFLTPLYNFGPKQIGFFYFTPVVAALLGELTGHWLHDFVARLSMKRNHGVLEPEARLKVIWISTPFMIVGLILLGFCLEEGYHYMVTSVAWGLYVFGIMITTVGVNAYNLDAYPEASGEVASWINFARTAGGFIISYFQVTWANAEGTKKSLGTQAGIVGAAFIIILLLQRFGKSLRAWAGQPHFKTN
ncbi:major facilitator superfamily domain-containing protein [Leptodontidium sp. MPI-SDFR-AT-0119]|nr:major facilitator superfamily domain-containing protein [Leptodontidium sp. MPI-SDFR-AT-0119]